MLHHQNKNRLTGFGLQDTASLGEKAPKESQGPAPINQVTYFVGVAHSTVGWEQLKSQFAGNSMEARLVSICKHPPTPVAAAML